MGEETLYRCYIVHVFISLPEIGNEETRGKSYQIFFSFEEKVLLISITEFLVNQGQRLFFLFTICIVVEGSYLTL